MKFENNKTGFYEPKVLERGVKWEAKRLVRKQTHDVSLKARKVEVLSKNNQ